MLPKAADPKLPLGSLSGGVLVMLNASARKSSFTRSVSRNVLPSMRSACCNPGPRTGLRELLPIVNWGASLKALLSNHSDALRFANEFASPTRLGLCTAKPRLEFKLVDCETATVSPDCTRTRPAISHPEIFHQRGMR